MKQKKRCKHQWQYVSSNDFRDGTYCECTKCGKVSFDLETVNKAYRITDIW